AGCASACSAEPVTASTVPATTPAAVATTCVTVSAAETTCPPAVCATSFTRSTTRRPDVCALRAFDWTFARTLATAALASLRTAETRFLALAMVAPADLRMLAALAAGFAVRLAADLLLRAAGRRLAAFLPGFFPAFFLLAFAARFLAMGSFQFWVRTVLPQIQSNSRKKHEISTIGLADISATRT